MEFSELSPAGKLDEFLKYLISENTHVQDRTILVKYSITSVILIEVMDKLIDDGFVKNYPYAMGYSWTEYSITFDGRLFIELGGYSAKALADATAASLAQTEIDRHRTLDALLASNSTRLNDLTNRLFWATVAAGIAAFLLLIWQIFLWINPIYSDFPYLIFGIVRKAIH